MIRKEFPVNTAIPFQTSTNGNGGFPPVKDTRPYARPSFGGPKKPQANQSNTIPAPLARSFVPASIAKRMALCAKHHVRFNAMRSAFKAQCEAWKRSQPGYDETAALVAAHETKIRNAFRARNN